MQRILIILATLLLAFSARAQNLETILLKNRVALGLDARKEIDALQFNGNYVLSGTEAKMPFKLLQSNPDNIRVETTVFGFKAIQTYNGSTAWQLTPTGGVEARRVDPKDMKFLASAMAIKGPFNKVNKEKYRLIYEGKKEFKGQVSHIVYWDSPDEKFKYYINPKTYLIDRVRYEYQKNGGWYSMEYLVKSYMEFSGSKYPQEISAIINGVEMVKVAVSRIKIPEKLNQNSFNKPSY